MKIKTKLNKIALATSIVVAGLTTSNMVLAQTCSGVLITSDCQDLSYTGPGGPSSSVSINSGVTVSPSGYGFAVSLGDGSTNPNLNSFTNNGTISGLSGLSVGSYATVGVITNNGSMSVSVSNDPVYNNGTITTFTNSNSGTIGGGAYWDSVYNNTNGVITTLTNTGTINSSNGYAGIGNNGTITTLNNGQGRNNPLVYTGLLPTNYNIIINSPSNYGILMGTDTYINSLSGTMNFGISGTSTIASNTTYMDVLQGNFTTSNFTISSPTFNGLTFSLAADNSNPGSYNLVVGGGGVAPEMNASQIPQVGLLLGCLFFLMARKKENSEPMLTA